MADRSKGNIALLLTAIVWGTGFIAQKLGNEVLPPMTFNAVRQLMAAVVLCPIMLIGIKRNGYFSREKNTISQLEYKRKRMLMAFVCCGFFMMLGTMTQQIGLVTVSAGKSGFISAMYIVFAPVLSVVIGNRVHAKTFGCIALAMVGFGFLSLRGGLGNVTPGDWWTLVSAFGFGAQITAIDYFVDRENDLLISVLQMGFCGIVGLIIAVILEQPSLTAIGECMPILLYSTFVPTAIGYTLQIVGQKYTAPSTAALLMSLEAVFAAIFGAIFLQEMMSARELLGSAIIFAAVVLEQVDIKNGTQHE